MTARAVKAPTEMTMDPPTAASLAFEHLLVGNAMVLSLCRRIVQEVKSVGCIDNKLNLSTYLMLSLLTASLP